MNKFENPVNKQEYTESKEYLELLTNKLVKESVLKKETLERIQIIQFAPCGFFEGENVRILVENFVNSNVESSERMLILFANGNDTETDLVSEIASDYKKKNIEENIILLKNIWENNIPVSMGLIRAVPVEFIKKIYCKEGVDTNPIIVSNDADPVEFSRDYLENLVKHLDKNEFGGSVSRFKFCGHNFLYDLNIALGEIDRSIRRFSRT